MIGRPCLGVSLLVGSIVLAGGTMALEGETMEAAERPEVSPLGRADTLPEPAAVPELLASADDRDRALQVIRARAVALASDPERATPWIQLLALVEGTGPEAGSLAARALLQAEGGGRPAEAASQVEGGLEEVPEEDRASLLAFAAHLMEEAEPARAAALREALLEVAPGAPEATEARFLLARHLADVEGERARALQLLEELVVGAPSHPMAPAARHLLEELRRPPEGSP